MAAPSSKPCEPWQQTYVCDGLPRNVDQTVLTSASVAATEVLWALSGRRFGVCTETVRPIARHAADSEWDWRYLENATYGWGWSWRDAGCLSCPPGWCRCLSTHELMMWREPIIEVTALTMDGTALPVSGANCIFRVDDWRRLVRTDGGTWPLHQDLRKPLTEAGTWSITYRYGYEPPELAKQACGMLACELAKAMLALPCKLPERVTSVSRQGVSLTLSDPADYIEKGRTGIYLVDLFLATYNRPAAHRAPRVFRADNDNGGRRTGT